MITGILLIINYIILNININKAEFRYICKRLIFVNFVILTNFNYEIKNINSLININFFLNLNNLFTINKFIIIIILLILIILSINFSLSKN